ncbi:MAG TPA: SH3 domain-containing protein [Rhodospirillales bacterium]|nr:SH3 domain-containing protein [Rhodospirillales bacterium]
MMMASNRHGSRMVYALGVCAAVLVAAFSGGAFAAEKKDVMFRGVKIKPQVGTYIVLKDVRIRSAPKTKSKKVGLFKAGSRIHVVGRAAFAWVAVRENGKDVGFVYDQVLLPLIDGTLENELTGKAASGVKGGATCDYTISFEGKSAVEGHIFEIADYDVLWDCRTGARKVKFRTPMFITEAPYQMGLKRIFQINIDILDLDGGYEEIFSTTILFNLDKDRIVFDGVNIEKYGKIPKTKIAKVTSVPEALTATVEMAIQAWNKAAWTDLIKNMPKYPDPLPVTKKSAKPVGASGQ